MSEISEYKQKYIKYKVKYLNLVRELNKSKDAKLNIIIGGGIITAKNFFISYILNYYDDARNIFASDAYLNKITNLSDFPTSETIANYKKILSEKNQELVKLKSKMGNETILDEYKNKIKCLKREFTKKPKADRDKGIKEYTQQVKKIEEEIKKIEEENKNINPALQRMEDVQNEINELKDNLFKQFDPIFEKITKDIDENYIDMFCKLYMYGKLGNPNSIENKGRFIDIVEKYILLKENNIPPSKKKEEKREEEKEEKEEEKEENDCYTGYNYDENKKVKTMDKYDYIENFRDINSFVSLTDMENYIRTFTIKLDRIYEQKRKDKKYSDEQKELKDKGESKVEIELETDKTIIYVPTSEDGSRYYGRNTRWCTAAKVHNMFESYASRGPLYIIQDKNKETIKYQLHFESNQFMNPKDERVEMHKIDTCLNDSDLSDWINKKYYKKENLRVVLETDNVIVYSPKAKNEFDYLCKNTKAWDKENFNHGYIIMSKKNNINKYFLNTSSKLSSEYCKNEKGKYVNLMDVEVFFNDLNFSNWLNDYFYHKNYIVITLNNDNLIMYKPESIGEFVYLSNDTKEWKYDMKLPGNTYVIVSKKNNLDKYFIQIENGHEKCQDANGKLIKFSLMDVFFNDQDLHDWLYNFYYNINNVDIIFENDNLMLFNPKKNNEFDYLSFNTTNWECNEYSNKNLDKDVYVVMSKKNHMDKYFFSIKPKNEKCQDATGKIVKFNVMDLSFNDLDLSDWLGEYYYKAHNMRVVFENKNLILCNPRTIGEFDYLSKHTTDWNADIYLFEKTTYVVMFKNFVGKYLFKFTPYEERCYNAKGKNISFRDMYEIFDDVDLLEWIEDCREFYKIQKPVDVEVILNIDNLILYHPRTINEFEYLSEFTMWNFREFAKALTDGMICVIVSKNNEFDKYYLHNDFKNAKNKRIDDNFTDTHFKNAKNESIDDNFIDTHFNYSSLSGKIRKYLRI